MDNWITQNADLVQLGLDAAITLVWIVYLHMFIMNLRRNRRADIHISLGASGKWFVSNLGLEPIFISDIFAKTETEGETRILELTDRYTDTDTDTENSGSNPFTVTTHGPLSSGGFMNICSRNDLVDRIRNDGRDPEEVKSVTISLLAQTAATDTPVGASRMFRSREGGGGEPDFVPGSMRTRQIRDRPGVRRLTSIVRKEFRTG